MNPLLRYRLATLCLTTMLLVVALAYAAQSFQVVTLRSQKRQLKRESRAQREEIARLRLAAANNAVYAFILARMERTPAPPPAAKPVLLEIADDSLCAAYDALPGYVCSTPAARDEPEFQRKMERAGAADALHFTEPKWAGDVAEVRVYRNFFYHKASGNRRAGYVTRYLVRYAGGKARLVEEMGITRCF